MMIKMSEEKIYPPSQKTLNQCQKYQREECGRVEDKWVVEDIMNWKTVKNPYRQQK